MKKSLVLASIILLSASIVQADISVTDHSSAIKLFGTANLSALTPAQRAAIIAANQAKRDAKAKRHHPTSGIATETTAVSPATRAAIIAANQAKRDAKRKKHHPTGSTSTLSHPLHPSLNATGSKSLIDAAGLKYFINTDITFSTTSSASGAASEASYTGPVVASTSGGGTTTSTLNDSFDGYNAICISLTGANGPCATGNANYVFYNQNGPAVFDTTVPAIPTCTNRQITFTDQVIGPLTVSRKVFVPTNDQYIRWMNYFTNNSAAPVTFNMITGNNLGSDNNTRIVTTSSGDNVATVADKWVTTFQNFSGSTSSDPRLGHVLQGVSSPTPVSIINFADGDDNPYWGYTITLAPGQSKVIMNYATAQGTKAAANAQADALSLLPASSTQCMGLSDFAEVANFAAAADLSIVKTSTPAGSINGGSAFSYTLAVTNNGPAPATAVSVSDTLPAGVIFGTATGTGWACNQAAGVVTCTMPTLPLGAANPITITATAPPTAAVLSNTATVSSTTVDPDPSNNTSTNTLNVVASADLSITKTTSTATAFGGNPISYTIAVTNNGPTPATSVSVTDTLQAGATFVGATGTGWTCNAVASVVTCTTPTLVVGAAPAITLTINAPATNSPSTLVNTATVSSATPDPVPANNSSTSTTPLQPASAIPTVSGWMMILIAMALVTTGLFRRG
ncbi:MAG: hypothetical protein JWN02_2150 [Acidobacteria bacterium]|nr:hypothetical protein [Acidobacteriota bacterium]